MIARLDRLEEGKYWLIYCKFLFISYFFTSSFINIYLNINCFSTFKKKKITLQFHYNVTQRERSLSFHGGSVQTYDLRTENWKITEKKKRSDDLIKRA